MDRCLSIYDKKRKMCRPSQLPLRSLLYKELNNASEANVKSNLERWLKYFYFEKENENLDDPCPIFCSVPDVEECFFCKADVGEFTYYFKLAPDQCHFDDDEKIIWWRDIGRHRFQNFKKCCGFCKANNRIIVESKFSSYYDGDFKTAYVRITKAIENLLKK